MTGRRLLKFAWCAALAAVLSTVLLAVRPAAAESGAQVANASEAGLANAPEVGLANAPEARLVNTPEADAGGSLQVRLTGSMLSVTAEDAMLGEVLALVSREASFTLEMSPGVGAVRLSTKFSNVELDRAIQRIFTVAGHKTFFIHYDDAGKIARLEVFGAGGAAKQTGAAPGAVSPSRRSTAPRTTRRPASMPAQTQTEPTPAPAPGDDAPFPDQPFPEDEVVPESRPDAPFIAPVGDPTYIPPAERN